MAENFPDLVRDIELQIQEAEQVPNKVKEIHVKTYN